MPKSKAPAPSEPRPKGAVSTEPAEIVHAALQAFAERGLFRAYSRLAPAHFKMQWHRDRDFDLIINEQALTFLCVLPQVKAGSSMHKEFRHWVNERQNANLPDHRRIDAAKAALKCVNKKGDMQVTLTLRNPPDWDYGARKLVALVHEVYMSFLHDGKYYKYMIDVFDLDPDHM